MTMTKRLFPSLRACAAIAMTALSLAAFAQAPALAPPLTPAQAAYLKAESQRAEDRFVNRVAEISGARRSAVRRAMPAKDRITDPVNRVVAALERGLEQPLTDDQKQQIGEAETAYRRELQQVEINARKR